MSSRALLAQAAVGLFALALASTAFVNASATIPAAAALRATGLPGTGIHAPGPVANEDDTPIIRGSGR